MSPDRTRRSVYEPVDRGCSVKEGPAACQLCTISSAVGGSRPLSSTPCTDNYRAVAGFSFRARGPTRSRTS